MVGTSISDEVDGIRAPTMWLTHQFNDRYGCYTRVTPEPEIPGVR